MSREKRVLLFFLRYKRLGTQRQSVQINFFFLNSYPIIFKNHPPPARPLLTIADDIMFDIVTVLLRFYLKQDSVPAPCNLFHTTRDFERVQSRKLVALGPGSTSPNPPLLKTTLIRVRNSVVSGQLSPIRVIKRQVTSR